MEKKPSNNEDRDIGSNKDMQGVDKAPGEEAGKSEEVTKADLKGKKVDADLSREEDKPSRQ